MLKGNLNKMAKPSSKRILFWYRARFPDKVGKSHDINYFNESVSRFESPRVVWGTADSESRRLLKKHFPKTFKDVKIEDNLYDERFGNKYSKW